jgi:hypothetical protein
MGLGSKIQRGGTVDLASKQLLARSLLQQDQLFFVEGVVVDQLVFLTESGQCFESFCRVHAR